MASSPATPRRHSDLTASSGWPRTARSRSIEPEFRLRGSGLEELPAGVRRHGRGGRSEYLRGFLRAATAIREDIGAARADQRRGGTGGSGCDVGADRLPGAAEHEIRCRDQGRRPRHRLQPRASRLRRPHVSAVRRASSSARQCRTCTVTARTASAPRAAPSRRQVRRHATASAYQASIFVGKVLSNTGSARGPGPRRHELGDRPALPGDLDVPGVVVPGRTLPTPPPVKRR